MKALISSLRRTLPVEMRHLKFKDVVISDHSVTLISRDAEINLLRDEGIDAAVMEGCGLKGRNPGRSRGVAP